MPELPLPVRDFILELTAESRSPAYLLIAGENSLLRSGGDLAAYGLSGLAAEHAETIEHAPFLQGLLPLETRSVFLPHMATGAGRYADVYLFNGEEGAWVLLLDSTTDAAKRQHMQQKTYDLSLQVSDLEREEAALYEAQNILEERVRERTREMADMNLQLRNELTERKRVEAALRKSESRFRRLSDSNMIGIMFWDVKGRITEANDALLEMLGYTREDLQSGRINWEQVTRQEGHSLDEQAFAEMRDTGACKPFKRQFVRKDGTPTTLLFGAALLEGSQTQIVCFALDLSRYQ
jgi:PAS domain S-box-containing protein